MMTKIVIMHTNANQNQLEKGSKNSRKSKTIKICVALRMAGTKSLLSRSHTPATHVPVFPFEMDSGRHAWSFRHAAIIARHWDRLIDRLVSIPSI